MKKCLVILLILFVGIFIFISQSSAHPLDNNDTFSRYEYDKTQTVSDQKNGFGGLLPQSSTSNRQPEAPQTNRTDIASPITKKVLILEFNPIIEAQGNRRLTDIMGWHNPQTFENWYALTFNQFTNGVVNYQIVERRQIDAIPIKQDGFQYTDATYLNCINNQSTCHQPDLVNYNVLLTQFGVNVCALRNSSVIDEVWLWGGPFFGFWESAMAGPNAFGINGDPITGTSCQKQLVVMGFNYEARSTNMLESMGHRVEHTMKHVFNDTWRLAYGPPPQSPPPNLNDWEKFSAKGYDPVTAGCGVTHGSLNKPTYDPNNYWSYDWNNGNVENSTCEDFLNYPNLTGHTTQISCQSWGATNCATLYEDFTTVFGFHRYWFSHIPKYMGQNVQGKWNNWWRYILDYEEATQPLNPPRGNHGSPQSCTLIGWTCDPNRFSQPLNVYFYEGANLVGQILANQTRENAVAQQCGGVTTHGFTFAPPPNSPLRNGQPHQIIAKAMDINASGNPTDFLQSLTGNPQTIICTTQSSPSPQGIPGDINHDGHVNLTDFNLLSQNFGNQTCGNQADLNSDCRVDIFDHNILVENYGR